MANTAVTIYVLKTFIFLFFGVTLTTGLETSTCVPHGYAFSNGRLDTQPLASLVSLTLAKCVAACLESEGCVSINYCKIPTDPITCELLDKTVCSGTNISQSATDWKHYVIGCLENVLKQKKATEYRACYEGGFCNDTCDSWSLAGSKKSSNTGANSAGATGPSQYPQPPSTATATADMYDHKGTSFVTGFLQNRAPPSEFFGFYISSCNEHSVTYNITAPRRGSGVIATGVVQPYQTTTIAVPTDLETTTGATVEDKGILIQSSDEVAVLGFNAKRYTIDAFSVMPHDSLGSKYFLVTWQPASFL